MANQDRTAANLETLCAWNQNAAFWDERMAEGNHCEPRRSLDRGQPTPHLLFHRPLQALLGAAFDAGLVLDGLEERSFPPDHPGGSDLLSWGGNYSEIPPVFIARLRHPG